MIATTRLAGADFKPIAIGYSNSDTQSIRASWPGSGCSPAMSVKNLPILAAQAALEAQSTFSDQEAMRDRRDVIRPGQGLGVAVIARWTRA